MPKLKPRAPSVEAIDRIEEDMCTDEPREPLMPDTEALRLMQDPEQYASKPLPKGLYAWVHAQPGGAEIWNDWIRKVWAATDAYLAAKRATQTVS